MISGAGVAWEAEPFDTAWRAAPRVAGPPGPMANTAAKPAITAGAAKTTFVILYLHQRGDSCAAPPPMTKRVTPPRSESIAFTRRLLLARMPGSLFGTAANGVTILPAPRTQKAPHGHHLA